MRPFLLAMLAASAALCACQQRAGSSASGAEASSTASALAVPSAAPSASADPTRLPEDPVAGQRATAQWREHLAEEETERKLNYDRRKLPEHRAVLALFRALQARYDRARSLSAVEDARSSLPRASAPIAKRIEAIDHWGVNSNVLGDYAALQRQLETNYPEARAAALAGDARALEAAKADFDARLQKIEQWLERAADSEDE